MLEEELIISISFLFVSLLVCVANFDVECICIGLAHSNGGLFQILHNMKVIATQGKKENVKSIQWVII